MLFESYRPPPPLNRFVSHFWYCEGPQQAHARDRIMPTGTASMIINLGEDEVRTYHGEDAEDVVRQRGAVLAGMYSRFFVIDTAEQQVVAGVEFHPGGTWPFFDPAADETKDQHVSLRDLWGIAADDLYERLHATAAPAAKLALLESTLLAQMIRPITQHPVVAFAVRQLRYGPGATTIGALSECAGISRRRLGELFSREIGLTPKRYARICRFQRAAAMAGADACVDWADVSLACGYFDQAHLIRDFKDLAGLTPTRFLERHTLGNHHVPIV